MSETPKGAFTAGKKAAEAFSKATAGEMCPHKAVQPKTKAAFLRDCYFAGVHGEPMPVEPTWFKTAD